MMHPNSLRASLAVVFLIAVAGCGDDAETENENETPEQTEAPEPAHVDLDADNTALCATCHAGIVEEWQTSMHSQAHHERDPIYGAMRQLRMAREGEEVASRCAQCHNPRAPDDLASEAARAGVSCATCHNVAAIDREAGKGARAIQWAEDDTMRGVGEAGEGAPHRIGPAAPWLEDGQTICLTCHDNTQNPQGVEACSTGSEFAAAGGDQSCTSCHMPQVEGAGGAVGESTHRSHAFLGPHHLWREDTRETGRAFMASAIQLRASREGETLQLEVVNQSGHALPSGFPGRMVIIAVTGFDENDQQVWRNFEQNPMADDPAAVFNKVYVDEEGEPTLPPFAARLARDSRLQPGETRNLQWTVPESVQRVQIRALLRLLPPPAVTALSLEGPLTDPRPIAETSL